MDHRFSSPAPSNRYIESVGIQRSAAGIGVDYHRNSSHSHREDMRDQYRYVDDELTQALPSISSHQDYPACQPFINDDYRRDISKPGKPYPQNNRQEVMAALRSLQEKMRQLELERELAENNLKALASEKSQYRDILRKDHDTSDAERNMSSFADDKPTFDDRADHSLLSMRRFSEGQSNLDNCEKRYKLLEQQLDCMRNMVQNAEHDRSNALHRSNILEEQRDMIEQEELRNQLAKITELEREHLKLTATQTLSENKIRELEEKLKEERHYRKLMQSKAAELEAATKAQNILMEATGSSTFAKNKKSKKKKKLSASAKSRPTKGRRVKAACTRRTGTALPEHYRLNLADIPFITGKSTTPSHSLAANFQEVLALMKTHNPKLCQSPRSNLIMSEIDHFTEQPVNNKYTVNDLTDLLIQLQDEFGKMSIEHQELSEQINSATDPRLQEDLERELDALVVKMEAKGDQIARLRRHQEKLAMKQRHSRKSTSPSTVTSEIPCRDTDYQSPDQVVVTTTVQTRGTARITSPGNHHASLNLYKGLKRIQNTLRKDDVSWD